MVPTEPSQPARCTHCKIRSIGLCAALTPSEFTRLNAMATHRHFDPGQTIRVDGEPILFYGNIVEGVAKKVKSTPDGREQIVGLLFEGDLLDQMFFEDAPYSIEAVSRVTLCAYPKQGFEALVRADPNLEHRLLHHVLEELNQAQDWMLLLGRKTAREKVASFLLLLAKRDETLRSLHEQHAHVRECRDPHPVTIAIPVSRSVMADYLGLTTETVCRQMTLLRHDDIIHLPDNHSFTLLDPCRLEHAAGE